MTRRSVNLIEFWLRLCFYSIPPSAFGTAAYIRFKSGYFGATDITKGSYLVLILCITLLWALVVEHIELDSMDTLVKIRTGIKMSFIATSYCSVITLAGLFFYRGTAFARLFVVVGYALTFLFSLGMIHVVRGIIYTLLKSPRGRFPIAILGADAWAARVAEHLSKNVLAPCKVACHVALPGETSSVVSAPLLEWSDLEQVSERYNCREVLIALPLNRFGEAQTLKERLQTLCIPSRLVLSLGDGDFVPEGIFDFCGLPLLDVRPYPVDTVGYAVGKRVFDVIFSLICLILTAPLMCLIALLIKSTSLGPIFFSQERVSLNGRKFRMLKFRTMYIQDSLSSSTQHTMPQDPRITSVGKLLRKTSLDEIPQFINALMGEMSVVGPRPELTHFVQKFRDEIPSYMVRHNVKCGITGWAQVNGMRGSSTSISDRVQYDLFYLRNWSMAFDCKIILLTLFSGLVSHNAY